MNSIIGPIQNKTSLRFCIFLSCIIMLTALMMYFFRPICIGNDPYFHHTRIRVLMEALHNGTFPFYIDYLSENGLGYFSQAFYCDLLLIPFAFIGNLTNLNFGYDCLIFSNTVLCGVFMYLTSYHIFKNTFGAFLAAFFYAFSPYVAFTIYYTAFVGEYISYTFIPIAFWGIYEIIRGDYRKWYILAIGFSLVIFAHVITSITLAATLFLFVLINYKQFLHEKKRILSLVIATLCCVLLCAYYLFPMIEQYLSNTFYFQIKPTTNIIHSVVPLKVILVWMTSAIGNMEPKIGILLVGAVLLRLFINKKSENLKIADLGVAVGAIYLICNLSFFPWDIFPFSLLGFIQFAWRLLKYSVFFFALAGGYYISLLLKKEIRKIAMIILLCIFTAITLKYDSEAYKTKICGNNPPVSEELMANSTIGGAEYLPAKIPSRKFFLSERGHNIEKQRTENKISAVSKSEQNIFSFDAEIITPERIEAPLVYYKGYVATLNNKEIDVNESDNGLVEIPIENSGHIKVWYKGTHTQTLSCTISLLSLFLLCIYIFKIGKRRQSTDNKKI